MQTASSLRSLTGAGTRQASAHTPASTWTLIKPNSELRVQAHLPTLARSASAPSSEGPGTSRKPGQLAGPGFTNAQIMINHALPNTTSPRAEASSSMQPTMITPILRKSSSDASLHKGPSPVKQRAPRRRAPAIKCETKVDSQHNFLESRLSPKKLQSQFTDFALDAARIKTIGGYDDVGPSFPSIMAGQQAENPSPKPKSTPDNSWPTSGSAPALDSVSFKVLTASYDGTAKLFNASSGECERTFVASRGFVTSAVFSPDARSVLAAPFRFDAKLFDLNSGKCTQTYHGHRGFVSTASFSADGTKVLTASKDHTSKIFNAADGKIEHTLSGHSNGVNTAVFSEDGLFVVSASADCTARLFNVELEQCISIFSDHRAWLCSAAFSPDSRQVVTSSKDGTAKIFDICSGACEQTFSVDGDIFTSAGFSPDARLVLTTSRDANARLYDVRDGACVRVFHGHRTIINSATFSPDGFRVLTASGDCTARLYDVGSGKCEQAMNGHRAALNMAVFAYGVALGEANSVAPTASD